MSLAPGTLLGTYKILAPIGAGGMGEVYQARDTKLGRDVAIKVLPEAVSQNKDRLARFEREARLLAALNHPNIAAIYGLEVAESPQPERSASEASRGARAVGVGPRGAEETRFLIMELVPGETLAERIQRGPIPVDDVLPLFHQIAEGLEAAHEKGIIHRDLKPANIKVTPEDKVKILDFGLAKALDDESPTSDLSQSPTITRDGTATGVILGTAAYMSPEQARGREVDKRTDIWAFGCVLYEALTGRATFLGETLSDTLAGILEKEPNWGAVPRRLPARIRDTLRSCLNKDAHFRLRDIGDARIAIYRAISEPSEDSTRRSSPSPAFRWVPAMLAAIATGVIVWSLTRPPPTDNAVARYAFNLSPSASIEVFSETSAIAISPDGTKLVYVARREEGTELFIATRDRHDVAPIPGTEDALGPFFSPDGQWIGFFAEGKLKKVPIDGGATVTLGSAPGYWQTGVWRSDGTIFGTDQRQVWRISAAGGTPETVATPDVETGEVWNLSPEILPNGRTLLFTTRGGGSAPDSAIVAQSLETRERRVLLEGGAQPRYAPTGHLIYTRAGSLLAAPFDPDKLELMGPAMTILDGVLSYSTSGLAHFDFSRNGTLVYVPGSYGWPGGETRTLHWVNRRGESEPLLDEPRSYESLQFSPDGRRLVMTILDGPLSNLWMYDIVRGSRSRITFDKSSVFPIWTPDGKRLAFSSDRGGSFNLYWQSADGSDSAERLTTSTYFQMPGSFSPNGKTLVYQEHHPTSGFDLWLLGVNGDSQPRQFLASNAYEGDPVVSPDGRWIAYVSDESDRFEVYVQAFPGPGGKWPISTDGGSYPLWSSDGRELFYRNGDDVMVVSIEDSEMFIASKPKHLFEVRYEPDFYAIAPDGQRFAMVRSDTVERTQVNIVLNWFSELERLVPTN